MKNFGEKEAWAYPGTAQCFGYHYYLRNGQSYGLQIWPDHSQCPYKQKPIKIFGKKGGWAYPGTVKNFWVPPIISGTGKATNFKFCTNIYWLNRNKSPLQISGKLAVGVVRDSLFVVSLYTSYTPLQSTLSVHSPITLSHCASTVIGLRAGLRYCGALST